ELDVSQKCEIPANCDPVHSGPQEHSIDHIIAAVAGTAAGLRLPISSECLAGISEIYAIEGADSCSKGTRCLSGHISYQISPSHSIICIFIKHEICETGAGSRYGIANRKIGRSKINSEFGLVLDQHSGLGALNGCIWPGL